MVQFPGDPSCGGESNVDAHLGDTVLVGGAAPAVVGAGVLLADGRKDPIEDKFLPMVVYGDRFADVAPMSGLPIVRL